MNRKGLTVLQLLIIIAVTGFVAYLLISNHSGKKISASDTLVTPSQETAIPENKKEEIKIIPSDVEEAFQSEEPNIDFVSKDRIPKLQVKQQTTISSYCGQTAQEITNKIVSIIGSEDFKNSCRNSKVFDVNGYTYSCNFVPGASGLTTSVKIKGTEKVEGRALDLLNCEKRGYFELNGQKYSCPSQPEPVGYEECLKIKNKLGIKECFDSSVFLMGDKWAGAVKQCGGVKNLPTMKDLAEINSVIFEGNPTLKPYEYKIVKYKAGLANYVDLWSNEELGHNVCGRTTDLIFTHDGLLSRSINIRSHAICKLN